MSKQSILARAAVVGLPLLVFLFGAFATRGAAFNQPADAARSQAANVQPNCVGKTKKQKAAMDTAIREAIEAKIRADQRFNEQRRHINVSAKNRVVMLQGWVKGADQVKALIELAQNTDCVKPGGVITSIKRKGEVIILLKDEKLVGNCNPVSQRQCCDGCILIGTPCNCQN